MTAMTRMTMNEKEALVQATSASKQEVLRLKSQLSTREIEVRNQTTTIKQLEKRLSEMEALRLPGHRESAVAASGKPLVASCPSIGASSVASLAFVKSSYA